MKKLYSLLAILFVYCIGYSQTINIPDTNFKNRLLASSLTQTIAKNASGGNIKIDANDDGEIQVSEAQQVYQLRVKSTNYAATSKFLSLEGISSFTNLTYLECQGNLLTALDLSTVPNLTYLNCGDNQINSLNISNSTGLETLFCNRNRLTVLDVTSFTNLTILYCHENLLTTLDASHAPNLGTLYCQFNGLTSLNVSGLNNLTVLYCYYNDLISLDVSGLSSLQTLWCYEGPMTSLNVQGCPSLVDLDCKNNELPTLNVSNLTALQRLICSSNSLTSLNTTGCNSLQNVECDFNQLATLSLTNLPSLLTLKCNNNLLTQLNVSNNAAFKTLNCYNNQLTTLNITNSPMLERLDCYTNAFTSLDLTGFNRLISVNCYDNDLTSLILAGCTGLVTLNCSSNNLQTLDLSDCPVVSVACLYNSLVSLFIKNGKNESITFSNNPSIRYICCDEGQITNLQNLANSYGYTNCNVNSYCSFVPGGTFYTIQGNNRYDSNGDGCDASDTNIPNLRMNFSDGTNTGGLIPNASGSYQISVQAGTHTITPVLEMPAYFNISPTTATVTFPTATSPFTQDFCVTANGTHNDLEITLFLVSRLTAGGMPVFKMVYRNKGTHIQSGSVNFTYDDAVLDFINASPVISGQGTNNLSWNFTNLQPFESRAVFVVLHANTPTSNPPINIGDVLNFNASVTGATDETPIDNTASFHQTIQIAFDPNDKTCLEGAIVGTSVVGEYVHYQIRFENTGTANAENIVVADAIDATKFDINSLVPIDGSHSFITRINTNKAEFVFENINLPFDDAHNDGYVTFKIKTKPTLVVGDTFSNAASIYFDYNFPIVTDTFTSTIQLLGTPDLDFETVFSLSPVPAKNVLNITNKQNVLISSVSIYNTLGQLVQVTANPNEAVDVSGLKTGNYFIKIISDKGTAVSKFVKE